MVSAYFWTMALTMAARLAVARITHGTLLRRWLIILFTSSLLRTTTTAARIDLDGGGACRHSPTLRIDCFGEATGETNGSSVVVDDNPP